VDRSRSRHDVSDLADAVLVCDPSIAVPVCDPSIKVEFVPPRHRTSDPGNELNSGQPHGWPLWPLKELP